MHLLVSRSRSSAKVKVKYKSYISQKMAVSGGIHFSQTDLVCFFFPTNLFDPFPNDEIVDSFQTTILNFMTVGEVLKRIDNIVGKQEFACYG